MKHTVALLPFLFLLACGDGDGPAWTQEPADDDVEEQPPPEPEAPEAPEPGPAPDEDEPRRPDPPRADPPAAGDLVLDDIWSDGLEIEVEGLAWTGPGEMVFRVELIDPTTGQPAARVGEPRFREDGVDLGTEALYTASRTQDLHVTLVLDLSRSMREARAVEPLRAAARRLVETLPREARVSVVGFATDHTLMVDFDGGDDLLATLEALEPPQGRAGQFTNLWGAIAFAADHLTTVTDDGAARALVVFTDGRDNVAEASFEEAADALADARAAVYAVGLGADVDASALKRLTGEGRYTGVRSAGALESVFDDVATRLSDRLTIEYVTPKQRGAHTLDVEFGDPDRSAGFTVKFEL